MKRCPSCQRTYTDDAMTNCAHDDAPLMPAAYSPQGAPMIPPPQGFATPAPPPGYPPQLNTSARRPSTGALRKRPPRRAG